MVAQTVPVIRLQPQSTSPSMTVTNNYSKQGWPKVRSLVRHFSLVAHYKYTRTANEHLDKTKAVLDDHENSDNKKLIISAFGQKAYANDIDEIKANVNKISDANMRTRLPTQKKGVFEDKSSIGVTNWVHEGGQFRPDSVGFGKKFYGECRCWL